MPAQQLSGQIALPHAPVTDEEILRKAEVLQANAYQSNQNSPRPISAEAVAAFFIAITGEEKLKWGIPQFLPESENCTRWATIDTLSDLFFEGQWLKGDLAQALTADTTFAANFNNANNVVTISADVAGLNAGVNNCLWLEVQRSIAGQNYYTALPTLAYSANGYVDFVGSAYDYDYKVRFKYFQTEWTPLTAQREWWATIADAIVSTDATNVRVKLKLIPNEQGDGIDPTGISLSSGSTITSIDVSGDDMIVHTNDIQANNPDLTISIAQGKFTSQGSDLPSNEADSFAVRDLSNLFNVAAFTMTENQDNGAGSMRSVAEILLSEPAKFNAGGTLLSGIGNIPGIAVNAYYGGTANPIIVDNWSYSAGSNKITVTFKNMVYNAQNIFADSTGETYPQATTSANTFLTHAPMTGGNTGGDIESAYTLAEGSDGSLWYEFVEGIPSPTISAWGGVIGTTGTPGGVTIGEAAFHPSYTTNNPVKYRLTSPSSIDADLSQYNPGVNAFKKFGDEVCYQYWRFRPISVKINGTSISVDNKDGQGYVALSGGVLPASINNRVVTSVQSYVGGYSQITPVTVLVGIAGYDEFAQFCPYDYNGQKGLIYAASVGAFTGASARLVLDANDRAIAVDGNGVTVFEQTTPSEGPTGRLSPSAGGSGTMSDGGGYQLPEGGVLNPHQRPNGQAPSYWKGDFLMFYTIDGFGARVIKFVTPQVVIAPANQFNVFPLVKWKRP